MASKPVNIFISKVCRDFCSRGVLEKMETQDPTSANSNCGRLHICAPRRESLSRSSLELKGRDGVRSCCESWGTAADLPTQEGWGWIHRAGPGAHLASSLLSFLAHVSHNSHWQEAALGAGTWLSGVGIQPAGEGSGTAQTHKHHWRNAHKNSCWR